MDFFAHHTELDTIGLIFFPRPTLLLGHFAHGGLIWWLGWAFLPHILVAFLSIPYLGSNPGLVIGACVIGVTGTCTELELFLCCFKPEKRYEAFKILLLLISCIALLAVFKEITKLNDLNAGLVQRQKFEGDFKTCIHWVFSVDPDGPEFEKLNIPSKIKEGEKALILLDEMELTETNPAVLSQIHSLKILVKSLLDRLRTGKHFEIVWTAGDFGYVKDK